MILALTGPKGSGKSGLLFAAAGALESLGLSLGGVISLSRMNGRERIGYDLLSLPERERELLALKDCRADDAAAFTQFRSYAFSNKALARGRLAIEQGRAADCLFLDEIGFWELAGGGWSAALPGLSGRAGVCIIGVRREVLNLTEQAWGFLADRRIDLAETDHETALKTIIKTAARNCKGDSLCANTAF